MKNPFVTLILATALLISPNMAGTAEASVGACIKGIKACGSTINDATKTGVKDACRALRDCKKECRTKKKAERVRRSLCRKDSANREAIKNCIKNSETSFSKSECKKDCRAQYKSEECVAKREELVTNISEAAGTCATGLAACTPAKYVLCLEGISYCARKAPKVYKDIKKEVKNWQDMAGDFKELGAKMKAERKTLEERKGECKSYKKCKKACRKAKTQCKQDNVCKSKSGDARKACRVQCRSNKKLCISECVESSDGKACAERRAKIVRSSRDLVLKVIEAVKLTNKTSKKAKKAYGVLMRCKAKLSTCF